MTGYIVLWKEQELSWNEASDICNSVDAHLPMIVDEEEEQIIPKLLRGYRFNRSHWDYKPISRIVNASIVFIGLQPSKGRWLNGVPWWNRALFQTPNFIVLRQWMPSNKIYNVTVNQTEPFTDNECAVYAFTNSPPSSSWFLVPCTMKLPINALICQWH